MQFSTKRGAPEMRATSCIAVGVYAGRRLSATASALETGRTAIGSAEEAYRVTTVLLAAGSANTTDLLDAQSALTQARLNFARARYEYALARLSLARALGD